MQVEEFGLPGQTDAPDRGAGLDLLAWLHSDAVAGYVTILRDPAIAVAKDPRDRVR